MTLTKDRSKQMKYLKLKPEILNIPKENISNINKIGKDFSGQYSISQKLRPISGNLNPIELKTFHIAKESTE